MYQKTPQDYNNGWKSVGTSLGTGDYALFDLTAKVSGISKSAILRSLIRSYVDAVVGLDQDPTKAREQWGVQPHEAKARVRKDAMEKLTSIRKLLLGEIQ